MWSCQFASSLSPSKRHMLKSCSRDYGVQNTLRDKDLSPREASQILACEVPLFASVIRLLVGKHH